MTVQVPGAVGLDFVNERLPAGSGNRPRPGGPAFERAQAPPSGSHDRKRRAASRIEDVCSASLRHDGHTLGQEDEVWAERAEFAGALVRECWEFDSDQERRSRSGHRSSRRATQNVDSCDRTILQKCSMVNKLPGFVFRKS